jgi:hypothetical protein
MDQWPDIRPLVPFRHQGVRLKGQSNESFFFMQRLTLVPIDMPRSDSEFRRISVELCVFKILKNQLIVVNDSRESKIEAETTHIFYTMKTFMLSSALHSWSSFFCVSVSFKARGALQNIKNDSLLSTVIPCCKTMGP